jgi:uncharacterized protein with HEPN domain
MPTDVSYFLDMLLAARKIKTFAVDLTEERFHKSELHQSAIIRELQVIGEAARLVSDEAKSIHSEINWEQIKGMRNRLIHEYFRIDLSIVWDVITNDIDTLISQLEPLIPSDEI